MTSCAIAAREEAGSVLSQPVSLKTLRVIPAVGSFERLPKWLNCIPLVIQWLWLSLRYRSFSLPSAANPHITCGGMVGEGKLEYFDAMGDLARSYTADYISFTVTDIESASTAALLMQARGLHFPIIVKPNLGWCGYGVRLLSDFSDLEQYFNAFPKGHTVILQRFLPEAGEGGLFYIRHPGESFGNLIGITLRYYPQITGDGKHSIRELIAKNPRLLRAQNNKLHAPDFDPDAISANGTVIRLATIGSTRIGGLYCDGSNSITPELTQAVDAIAKDMKDFYVGRFDVRYESLDQLRLGKGFTIMEVNGAGSESVHAWDPKYSIAESYRIIFAKQHLLFKIGDINRRKGHKPIGLYQLARLHFSQQKLIERYPLSN